MLYYIYCGYIASVTAYKIYEFWEIVKVTYTAGSYTAECAGRVYKWVKPEIELTEIELTEIELTELMEWDLVDKEENENIKINIGN